MELNLRFSGAGPGLSMNIGTTWGGRASQKSCANCCRIAIQNCAVRRDVLTSVTAVTDQFPNMGETPIVNMVRRARKKALFEPGDTRQQWKGEAAASFVLRDSQ